MNDHRTTKLYLDLAARSALRGFGLVEPNPMVGAVIVKSEEIIGIGHHTCFGALHAEREALSNSRANGHDPRGATLYCTLEPCVHHGKQPPCTEAVIEAGISRVIIARKDPAEVSCGGIEILRNAGIEVELSEISPKATHLSDPFIHRIEAGRPWVIAKWAQTLDGRIATRTGESQWISNEMCRRRVHRLRAKVDAVLIGIGTAMADDPMLTARDCRHVRRVAKRVVLDTHGRLDLGSKLVQSAEEIPTIICTAEPSKFDDTACLVIETPPNESGLDLGFALGKLCQEHAISTLLVEAGPRVLGSLIEADLINEAIVHLAPGVLADEQAKPVAMGRCVPQLIDMHRFELLRSKQIGSDMELHYRRSHL
jgi:diaminohydroxyphosphoribosylaminopyrimidine deaminase / 5-amino-6-(5-phosphoribosylamino)uracil reductase